MYIWAVRCRDAAGTLPGCFWEIRHESQHGLDIWSMGKPTQTCCFRFGPPGTFKESSATRILWQYIES